VTEPAGVLNPVDSEQWIRDVSDRIARGVRVVTAAEREAKARRRECDLAYAYAYRQSAGLPAHERRYAADITAMPHREAAETAEVAYRHAERTARALERELMAAMAVNSNIRTMYGAAGLTREGVT
jgi:hypothetical protein